MSSLCARASTELMTETCFRLGLTQTHTYVVHDPTCTAGVSHGGGPISLDNLFLSEKSALVYVSGQPKLRRKQRRQRAPDTSLVTIYLSLRHLLTLMVFRRGGLCSKC